MQPRRMMACIHVPDEILLGGLVRTCAYLVFGGLGMTR